MKILIISSSPRKAGNSEVLCERFAKDAAEAGHEAETLLLRNMSVAPCRACYACMETHTCAIQDDMKEIFQKLKAADVIVLASPVYFYSITAQMKAVIDRCLVDHKCLRNKKFYFIITAADQQHDAADGTLEALRGFLRCLPEAQEEGIIYGMGAWDKGDVYRHPAYEQAYQAGKEIQ